MLAWIVVLSKNETKPLVGRIRFLQVLSLWRAMELKEYRGRVCHAILDLHTYGFFASPGVVKKGFESYLTGSEQ